MLKKKYSRSPPFSLEKISRHFWSVFRKITQMDALTKKKIYKFFSGFFFNSSIEEQSLALKKIIKFHLHGSRRQKDAQKCHFFEGLTLGPFKKN